MNQQGHSLGAGWDRKGQQCHATPVTQPPSHGRVPRGSCRGKQCMGHCSNCGTTVRGNRDLGTPHRTALL